MSDTKPSRAAMNLAREVDDDLVDMCGETVPNFQAKLAVMLDSSLANLLEVCEAIATAPHLKVWPTVQTLAERLEPWKPEK